MKRASVHSTVIALTALSISVFMATAALSAVCWGAEPVATSSETLAPEAAKIAEELPLKSLEGKGQIIDEPGTFAKQGVTVTSPQVGILLRAARNSVALGDIPEALARFEKLLQLTPRDYQARFEYAGLLMQAGRWSDGRRQLEQLVSEQKDVGTYRLALADVLLRLKEYEEAREHLWELLSDERLGHRAAIKIARSFVLDHRVSEAKRFFDGHLRDVTDLDAADEPALAQLLIDLERPAEAVRLLAPLHEANRANETISAILLLAKVRMNARSEALEFIGQLDQQPLKDSGLWLDLAAQLYQEQAFPEALALFRQVWRRHPDLHRATLGMARTLLRLYEVDIAKKILNEYRGDPTDLEFSTVVADYHTLVGEYSEAIAIAKRRLQADEGDLQAAILLGDTYHASRQFTLAEAAYAIALANRAATDEELRREIRQLQAKNYYLSRRFDQAVAILNALIEERPSDIGSRILLIETLTEMRCYEAAAALARPTADVENPRHRFALRTQLGYVLLKQERWSEAAEQFRSLTQDSNESPPDVAYGLYRAATMLDQPEAAREAAGLGPSPLAPAATWGVIFAGQAMSYCDCRSAAVVLDDALRDSPRNVVLLNMRGEAAQQCDCDCRGADCGSCFPKIRDIFADGRTGNPPAPNGWFHSALQMSPTNIRARLGCARSFNKHLAYQYSYAEYLALLKLMPNDVNLKRETARMVEGWQGLERASAFYADGPAAFMREGAAKAAEAPPTTEADTSQRIGTKTEEFDPTPSSQLLSAEYQARYLRGWRLHQAIPAYERLIHMEPSNEAAVFDLAQSQSALNRTQCAIDTYQQLLDANPCHQDAAVALQRNQLELQPKVIGVFDYENQRGRQGLANMTWYNYSLATRRPLGDENEFVEWGYRERVLQPTDDRADFGEIPFVRWQEKYATDSLVFAEIAVEKYQYGLKTRPTFTAGIDVLTTKDTEVRVSGFLKNYYVCGEAIRQDIYTTGIQIDGLYRPRRLWTLSGYYRVANFSDNNWVNWVNLNSAHLILQGRRQIRGLIDYNFYTFAQQTIFGPIPGSLVGTIHPYWSPSGYSIASAGLEWKHWLSCDRFKGANEHYYTLFSGAAVDSNGQGYFIATSRWQRDLTARLTWTIDANLIHSQNQVYNAVGVTAYGVLRLW